MARPGTIEDESLVPGYELPSLLGGCGSAAEWETQRRPELLRLFREHVYGTAPEVDYTTTACAASHEVLSDEEALGGVATRRELRLRLEGPSGGAKEWTVLLYLPREVAAPVPCFLGLNFGGK